MARLTSTFTLWPHRNLLQFQQQLSVFAHQQTLLRNRNFHNCLRSASFPCKPNSFNSHNILNDGSSFSSPFNQVRKLKVDRYDHVPEDEEKHCWDGIYAEQISDFVIPKQGGGIILDLTFGSGKHTEKILSADPNVRVIAIDRDPQCEEDAARLKTKFPRRLCFLNIKFSDTVEALYNIGVNAGTLSGAVLDAGLSHAQLTVPGRGGFFNSTTEPLDFRMSGRHSQEPSAKDILNHIDEDSLYQVIKIYGQNKKARKISQAIIQARYDLQDIKTPGDLNLLIKILEGFDDETPTPVEDQQQQEVLEESLHDGTTSVAGFHSSAASTIRALRILVNNEVNELDCAIKCVHRLLLPDAPFAVVTYNVLEDTIVKRHFAGVDVDASVSTIGCPQHRYAKTLGFADPRECKPWTPQFKLVPSYQMTQNFSHWKHAKLRTATKNGGVAYEQVLEGV
ncbi:probable methyltransferase-like protein 15 homolog [Hyalella azteca]|uniref:Probable methyltransferase-like protein 15 homolog n=1 Tax=Hyalella azteca TaxID=294128 RepID=A0A8B7NV67_HYAAZ|nr:probable methyltransferase-like protein 15 homolog [Hyalella azteca]